MESDLASTSPSWMRACFGFSAVLLVAAVALFSYHHVSEQQMLLECKGDKKLLRKKKRGSIYVDLEGTNSYNFIKCTKTWTSDSEAAYHRLM